MVIIINKPTPIIHKKKMDNRNIVTFNSKEIAITGAYAHYL